MITSTKKVLALVMTAVATGAAAPELRSDAAQAEPNNVMTRDAAYAAARVDTAFDLIAMLPPSPPVVVPMAMKGDLPVPLNCLGISGDLQAECMDVAYELPAEPSIVVETREGTTTTLMRMDAMTIAKANEDIVVAE